MEHILHKTTLIIVKKGDKYLLIKRANEPGKGLWAFPGGHVDEGETPQQGAQREAEEEVGEVKVDEKPFYVFVHDVPEGERKADFKKHKHKCYVFFGKVAGEIKAGSDAEKIGWYTIDEIKDLHLTDYTETILKKLNEMKNS